MRYNSLINNKKSTEWGLDIKLAYLFSWFYELPSWAEKVIISNETYYFASKNKAISELPLLTDKLDTMYRYYKQIESLGLIKIKKIETKDYITLTEKGKTWNLQSEHSEINPNLLGNKSENNSDKNPTYNITSTNNKTINKYSFKKSLIDYGFKKELVLDWLEVRKKKKSSNTKTAFNGFIKQVELSKKDINYVLEECVNRSWAGFKAEWLLKHTNQNTEKQPKKDAATILQERYGLKQ